MTVPKFDWKAAVSSFTLAQGRELADERGLDPLTFERLRDRGLIGSVYVEKFKARCAAFPIHDKDGNVYRAHCRAPQPDNDGKRVWSYEPANDPLDRAISAFVIGARQLPSEDTSLKASGTRSLLLSGWRSLMKSTPAKSA